MALLYSAALGCCRTSSFNWAFVNFSVASFSISVNHVNRYIALGSDSSNLAKVV